MVHADGGVIVCMLALGSGVDQVPQEQSVADGSGQWIAEKTASCRRADFS